MYPSVFLTSGSTLRYSPSLHRLPSDSVRQLQRYYDRTKTPFSHPHGLRFPSAAGTIDHHFLRICTIGSDGLLCCTAGYFRFHSFGYPMPILFNGEVRASQVSGKSNMHLLRSFQTPVALLLLCLITAVSFCPRYYDDEDHNINKISRLNHTASALTVYASTLRFPYTGKTRF